jgi:hypothetical protein
VGCLAVERLLAGRLVMGRFGCGILWFWWYNDISFKALSNYQLFFVSLLFTNDVPLLKLCRKICKNVLVKLLFFVQ